MPNGYLERDIEETPAYLDEVMGMLEPPAENLNASGAPLPPPQMRQGFREQGYGVLEKFNPETGQRETFTAVNLPGTRLPQFPIPRPQRDPMEEMRKTINAIQFQKANDAYKAALSFQAARAYRQDLDAGKSQGEALARWGHMLPGGLAGAARMTEASRPAFTPEPLPGNTNLYRVGPRGERLFQYRPQEPVMAPTVTNVSGVNVMRYGQGGRSATIVPRSALPQEQGEIIIKYDPTSKRHFQLRNNQWYPVTSEEAKRLTPLEKTATAIDTKAMKDAAETLREETRKGKPDSKRAIQATKDYQSASNSLFQASQPVAGTPTPAPAATPAPAPTAPKETQPKFSPKSQADVDAIIKQANEAIAKGKDPTLIRKRLKEMGIEVRE